LCQSLADMHLLSSELEFYIWPTYGADTRLLVMLLVFTNNCTALLPCVKETALPSTHRWASG
jgi:hypothetical protein